MNRLGGSEGALRCAISELVLAGLPTTSTRTSRLATASSALPWAEKILAFSSSRSLRSMPGPRGRAPTSMAKLQSLKAAAASLRRRHFVQRREGAVVQLHHHALYRRARRRDLQQIQVDRLIGAEHLTGCDAKRERIADISGRARDGDSDWLFHD